MLRCYAGAALHCKTFILRCRHFEIINKSVRGGQERSARPSHITQVKLHSTDLSQCCVCAASIFLGFP